MENHFHKSVKFHSWLKMCQYEPIAHQSWIDSLFKELNILLRNVWLKNAIKDGDIRKQSRQAEAKGWEPKTSIIEKREKEDKDLTKITGVQKQVFYTAEKIGTYNKECITRTRVLQTFTKTWGLGDMKDSPVRCNSFNA